MADACGSARASHTGLSFSLRSLLGRHDQPIVCFWPFADISTVLIHVRFSSRPVGVKRFQAIQHCSVDVSHGLALLFGIGTRALPLWGFEDEVEQSLPRPCRQFERQVQADMRTYLIHRPARDIFPLLGGSRVFTYRV